MPIKDSNRGDIIKSGTQLRRIAREALVVLI